MHQERGGGHLVATVLVGECGGLLDGGKVLGGGRGVHMAHVYPRGRRGLDVTLSWNRRGRRRCKKTLRKLCLGFSG